MENKVVIIATSTGDRDSSEMTAAFLKTSAEQYAQVVTKNGGEMEEVFGEEEDGDEEDGGEDVGAS